MEGLPTKAKLSLKLSLTVSTCLDYLSWDWGVSILFHQPLLCHFFSTSLFSLSNPYAHIINILLNPYFTPCFPSNFSPVTCFTRDSCFQSNLTGQTWYVASFILQAKISFEKKKHKNLPCWLFMNKQLLILRKWKTKYSIHVSKSKSLWNY